jgi:hypothetical protein
VNVISMFLRKKRNRRAGQFIWKDEVAGAIGRVAHLRCHSAGRRDKTHADRSTKFREIRYSDTAPIFRRVRRLLLTADLCEMAAPDYLLSQGCTDPGRQNFVTVPPEYCGSLVSNLLLVILTTPRILRWVLGFFGKLVHPFPKTPSFLRNLFLRHFSPPAPPENCGSLVSNVLRVILTTPRILRWVLGFWKIGASLSKNTLISS